MKYKFYDDEIEITVELDRYSGKEYLCDYGSTHVYEDVYEPYDYTFTINYDELDYLTDADVYNLTQEEIGKLLESNEQKLIEWAEKLMSPEPDYD